MSAPVITCPTCGARYTAAEHPSVMRYDWIAERCDGTEYWLPGMCPRCFERQARRHANRYTCAHCGLEYSTPEDWAGHDARMHPFDTTTRPASEREITRD